MNRIVVIGGGQAGGQTVAALRSAGFDRSLHLIAAEPHLPYERPPLSKEVLLGEKEADTCLMKSESFYTDRNVELSLGTRVTSIDADARRVQLDSGDSVGYDALMLCTGSALIRLELPGADLEGIHYLRTWDESLKIRRELRPGAKLVVVGGGYIGLEVAAAGKKAGADTVVVEAADVVMGRVVDPKVGAVLRRFHEDKGVVIHTNARVSAFEGEGRVRQVCTEDGSRHDADVVVVGVGVRPDLALAQQAGLTIDDGIAVDAYGQTSNPTVFAAGDVTSQPNTSAGRRVRLESWQNAQFQAMVAARAMLGRRDRPHDMVPWFWSDQFDLNLQMVGTPASWDEVVFRGDELPLSAFYLKDGRVVAMNALGTHKDVRPAKKLIEGRVPVTAEALADLSVSLKELV